MERKSIFALFTRFFLWFCAAASKHTIFISFHRTFCHFALSCLLLSCRISVRFHISNILSVVPSHCRHMPSTEGQLLLSKHLNTPAATLFSCFWSHVLPLSAHRRCLPVVACRALDKPSRNDGCSWSLECLCGCVLGSEMMPSNLW